MYTKSVQPVELPPELLILVMVFLKVVARSNRKGLSSYTLVCKHWNAYFRSLLFESLSLRSAADLKYLTSILKNSSQVRRLLRQIILCESPATPWVHLAPLLLSPRLKALRTIEQRSFTLGTPEQFLPVARHIAAFRATFSALTSLTLTDCHFAEFAQLECLVGSTCTLQELHCVRLSWGAVRAYPGSFHTYPGRHTTNRRCSALSVITLRQCGPSWHLWRFFSAHNALNTDANPDSDSMTFLAVEDVHILEELTKQWLPHEVEPWSILHIQNSRGESTVDCPMKSLTLSHLQRD